MDNELIYSFDLGTGSMSSCVRRGREILYLNVDTLPAEFGSLAELRERRRQIRTRLAHKQREEWWKRQAELAGIEVLETGQMDESGKYIPPDPRLSREFSKPGDPTIYNSLLLRIALLQGERLEGWQIFKAVWSAIQHRGYDLNLPWKHKLEAEREEEEVEDDASEAEAEGKKKRKRKPKKDNEDKQRDERKTEQAVHNYLKLLQEKFGSQEIYYYPAYLEAYQLGIWSPEEPRNYTKTIGDNPPPVRNKDGKINFIAPAELVEKELKQLLIQAGKQYPYIEKNLNYILYGPSGCKYGAYLIRDFRRFLGKDWEWQGLLSQKTPRFDNRIIMKCKLIPRLNVCKRKDPLCKEVTFLMKLKNFRYVDKETGEEKALTPTELNAMYEKYKDKCKIGKNELANYVETYLNGVVHPSFPVIDAPKQKGRARFCRPALRLIKEVILSGRSPHELYREYVNGATNTDPRKGLIPEDYAFLLRLPAEWENFYIPDEREEEAGLSEEERLEKIMKLLQGITNAVVRHRLFLFYQKLGELKRRFGTPDKIVLEFPREPEEMLAGRKTKELYIKIQDRNKKQREIAENILRELHEAGIYLEGKDAKEKVRLWIEQSYRDPYDGFKKTPHLKDIDARDPYSRDTISAMDLNDCEIDHIVPRSRGGPDARWNSVLTRKKNNADKKDCTPFEWLGNNKEVWLAFVEHVKSFPIMMKKKKELLISENAQEKVQKYTHLAETSYISKRAQKICYLFFGFPELTEGSTRRVFVITGGFTSHVRKMFDLNRILYPHMSDEEYEQFVELKKQEGKLDEELKKNRDNPCHHALDALVASILAEVHFDTGAKRDKFPDWFNLEYCREAIDRCVPMKIRFEKPTLAETIYGLREWRDATTHGKKQFVFVTRFGEGTRWEDYQDLNFAKKYVKSIYSYNIRQDLLQKLSENPSPEEWQVFHHNYRAGGKPKKLLLVASSPFDEDEVQKFLSGELANLGEFIKGKMPGQFLKQSRESHGYFVYQDEKGKWQREPIYAFESPYKKKQEILRKHRGKEIYFFRSGMTVMIQQDIVYETRKIGFSTIEKGIYILNSIRYDNWCKLTSIKGQSFVMSLEKLMNLGHMKPINEKNVIG